MAISFGMAKKVTDFQGRAEVTVSATAVIYGGIHLAELRAKGFSLSVIIHVEVSQISVIIMDNDYGLGEMPVTPSCPSRFHFTATTAVSEKTYPFIQVNPLVKPIKGEVLQSG